MSQTTIPPLNHSPASADTSGLQSSLLKPKVQKNLDDNTESQKVDNDAGKQPKKVLYRIVFIDPAASNYFTGSIGSYSTLGTKAMSNSRV